MSTEVEDFISHFGKKGMKWGQRKSRAEKLQAVATRRPTRGNVRKAQRAQIRENRRDSPRSVADTAKRFDSRRHLGNSAAAGATFLLARSHLLNAPVSVALAGGAGLASNAILRKHYDKKLSSLNLISNNAAIQRTSSDAE